MKILITTIVLFLSYTSVFADEYKIDLQLKDLYLKSYKYTPAVAENQRITFNYDNRRRSYFLYAPKGKNKNMPVIVALHGAGRTGASMIDAWKNNANKYGFVVVAPNALGKSWDVDVDESVFFIEAANNALTKLGIAATEAYLFGHSSGAQKAISIAANYPQDYTAIAVHAGTLPNIKISSNEYGSKPRLGLFLGDHDHIFSVQSARQTTKPFTIAGYLTFLYILKNHSHWYYQDFDRINENVWAFFAQSKLDK